MNRPFTDGEEIIDRHNAACPQSSSEQVDPDFRTSNPRVFAVGDVTGPPGLASSAVMGGRSVSSYLFKGKMQQLRQYILETSKDLEVERDIS